MGTREPALPGEPSLDLFSLCLNGDWDGPGLNKKSGDCMRILFKCPVYYVFFKMYIYYNDTILRTVLTLTLRAFYIYVVSLDSSTQLP